LEDDFQYEKAVIIRPADPKLSHCFSSVLFPILMEYFIFQFHLFVCLGTLGTQKGSVLAVELKSAPDTQNKKSNWNYILASHAPKAFSSQETVWRTITVW